MVSEFEKALKIAVEKEEDSYKFYKNAAKEAETNEVRDFFLALALEELKHKKALEHLDIKHLHSVEGKRLTDIEIGHSLSLTSLFEYYNLKRVFDIAIKKEEDAVRGYELLREEIIEKSAKKLFEKLIQEELGHKNRLIAEKKIHFAGSVITSG